MRKLIIILGLILPAMVNAQLQKELKAQYDSLVSFIKDKDTESFATYTAYQGEDEKRNWKDSFDPTKPEELKEAKRVIEEMKKALEECKEQVFDSVREEKESEGTWYIYTVACEGGQKLHFAFLKIKGRYCLGDIDRE